MFAKFVGELSRFQTVHVLSGPSGLQHPASRYLEQLDSVHIHEVPTNDTWIRDFGPTFVRRVDDGSLVGVDWQFNSWGGKYPPFDCDARATEAICKLLGCERSVSRLCCEGGALETDGAGTLLTTSSVLLSQTRNPGWTRQMVEDELQRKLGVLNFVWVDGGGMLGDDTDGHIDQLARFVAPGVVVAAVSSHASDPNHDGLADNMRTLKSARLPDGSAMEIHALPTPPPRLIDHQRVPESYCNFLFANGAVLVPTFQSDATDRAALKLLEQLLPDRKLVPIDCSDLIWGRGALHCASQHQPLASPSATANQATKL